MNEVNASSSSEAAVGHQSDNNLAESANDNSGGSHTYESGSKYNLHSSPYVTRIEVATAYWWGLDEVITDDETIVRYMHIHELNPVLSDQLIDYYRKIWTADKA